VGKDLTFDVLAQAKAKGFAAVGNEVKGLHTHMKGLITLGAGLLAGGGLLTFFKDSVSEGVESQKVGAQTNAVIKSTGGAANVTAKQFGDLATKISLKTGIDDEQIQSSENMLATFTNVRNELGKGNDIFSQATQTVTDMSVALGVDGKNASVMLGKALNDPVAGVGALSRVGVTFTEQQKKQIATMVKSGDTLGAQKVILGELSKEFGGSAAAQATAGDKMKVAWGNLQEQVGTALIPILTKLANWLIVTVLPAFSKVVGWVQAHWPQISAVISNVWNGFILPVFTAVKNFIVNTLVPAFQTAVGWVRDHWPQIQHAFAVMWQQVKPVLESLRTYLQTLWHTVLEPIVDWVQKHWAVISQVFKVAFIAMGVVIKVFLVIFKAQLDIATRIIKALAATLNWLWHTIVMPVFTAIKTVIQTAVGVIKGSINGAITVVKNIGGAFKTAYTTAKTWIGNIVTAVTGLPGKISGLAGKMLNAGKALMGGLWNGIKSAAGAVADIGKAIVNSVIDFLNRILPHHFHVGINKGPFHLNVSAPLFPNIPHVAMGGITTGPTLAVVGDNPGGREAIIPLPRGGGLGGPVVLEIRSGGSKMDDLLVEIIRRSVRVRGGDVQTVLGRG